MSKIKLNSWYEIDSMKYMTYIIFGYEIEVDEERVIWRLNGKIHREDGPAVIWADGGQEWWLNDQIHREDGPAVVSSDGSQEWYLNGKRMTKHEWRQKVDNINDNSLISN